MAGGRPSRFPRKTDHESRDQWRITMIMNKAKGFMGYLFLALFLDDDVLRVAK